MCLNDYLHHYYSKTHISHVNPNYYYNFVKNKVYKSEINKMYIASYGYPDSWIAIKLDNDRRGYGYIRYKNNSDAFFERKIEILKLKISQLYHF